MGIAAKYYIKRYHQWFKANGFIQHVVVSELGTIYDHMYLYLTEVIGLGRDIAVSMIDEYRVDEVLQEVNKRMEMKKENR